MTLTGEDIKGEKGNEKLVNLKTRFESNDTSGFQDIYLYQQWHVT